MINRFKNLAEKIKNRITTLLMVNFSSIVCGKNVKFNNFSTVIKHKSSKIIINKNTTINSSNFGYHLNMHSKCKIVADRPNASISIGTNCRIHGTCIHAFKKINIGNNVLIAANTQIIDANGHLLSMDKPEERLNRSDEGRPITICDNVWIGANCIILGGVTIGAGSVISAGSVIKKNVPEKSIFGGNPAILIKQY